jgi:hypothetical protein
MKRNIVRFFCAFVFLACVIVSFSSCKDDNKCKLVVTVLDVTNTSEVISGVKVVVAKGSSAVHEEGITDSKGEARFTFENEAILDIEVSKTDVIGYTRTGKSTVRLLEGETVSKQVYLNK